ncbi:MAG: hypothetical protein ACU836_03375 [Gammaproteobacteria bacterium]
MDNDILINQARSLYAALHRKRVTSTDSRLESLIATALCRYQRRLNRCVLCYRHRKYDCVRDAGGKEIPCEPYGVSVYSAPA